MIAVNYTNVRANLKSYMDRAKNDFETIIITGKDGNVVMLSEEEYNNMKENYFIMSNPEMVKRLDESIKQIIEGKIVSGVSFLVDMRHGAIECCGLCNRR